MKYKTHDDNDDDDDDDDDEISVFTLNTDLQGL